MKKIKFYFNVVDTAVNYIISCDKDNGNIILKQDMNSDPTVIELTWSEFKKEICCVYNKINTTIIATNGDNRVYYNIDILAGDSYVIPYIVEMKKSFISKMMREDVYVFPALSYPIMSVDDMIDEVRQFLEVERTA
jgi:hypothetical protein